MTFSFARRIRGSIPIASIIVAALLSGAAYAQSQPAQPAQQQSIPKVDTSNAEVIRIELPPEPAKPAVKTEAPKPKAKPVEAKPAETKPTEAKPRVQPPAEHKPAPKPAAKPAAHKAEPEAAKAAPRFAFSEVENLAHHLASERYKQPTPNLPEKLQDLKYANYQNVQFREDHSHWINDGSAFRLGFYPEGMHFNVPVEINEIDEHGAAHPIEFNPDDFNYGDLKIDPKLLKGLGFAGFKILYPVNSVLKPNDELASFLGASYFRVIGRGMTYGLSARGLAIDTALPSGEEFPAFRKFWIVKPAKTASDIVVYALLDSPRATGAYRFTFHPGIDTVVNVKARIYLRDRVGRLGIAPLTSMFLYGSNQPSPTTNYRPEMHDSDGLAMHTGNDEWLWRPLNNPKRLAVSAFAMENPRGFGLLQRARNFHNYEDLDDHYEKRPSLWIQPVGDWGKGSVQLVEIPTPDETNDNIVAFWVPEALPKPGTPLDVRYKMTWTLNNQRIHDTPLAWVMQTRRSRDEVKGPDLIRRSDGSTTFIVDFVGASLENLPADATVTANVSSNENGQIVENTVRPNPVTGGRRLTLRVNVKDPAKPVEMRATLMSGQTPLSETWSYQMPPSSNEPESK
ncbi:MAG: glucan biosynthesis protein G [Bordetella sp.]|uniref:glucan biosynthesis protein G n=1 Tax=Bordetella sp. TaxID=28081 RepID=UPI003F7C839A